MALEYTRLIPFDPRKESAFRVSFDSGRTVLEKTNRRDISNNVKFHRATIGHSCAASDDVIPIWYGRCSAPVSHSSKWPAFWSVTLASFRCAGAIETWQTKEKNKTKKRISICPAQTVGWSLTKVGQYDRKGDAWYETTHLFFHPMRRGRDILLRSRPRPQNNWSNGREGENRCGGQIKILTAKPGHSTRDGRHAPSRVLQRSIFHDDSHDSWQMDIADYIGLTS